MLETVSDIGDVPPPYIEETNEIHRAKFLWSTLKPPTFTLLPSGYTDDELNL